MKKIKQIILGTLAGIGLSTSVNANSNINNEDHINQLNSMTKEQIEQTYSQEQLNQLSYPENGANVQILQILRKKGILETPSSGDLQSENQEQKIQLSKQKIEARKYLIKHRAEFGAEKIKERLKIPKWYKNRYNISDAIKPSEQILDLSKLNSSLANLLYRYAQKYDINPKLYISFAIPETRFGIDGNKTSSAKAKCNMQITPIVFKEYNLNPKDPQNCYIAAAKHIKKIASENNIDVSFNSTLSPEDIVIIGAGYNAGPTRLRKDPQIAIFNKETKNYLPYLLSANLNYNFIIPETLEEENGVYIAKTTKLL